MKVGKLLYSMNDISDSYITEYAKKNERTSNKKPQFIKSLGIIAACLALAIICTPALIHIFTPAEIEDPKAGVHHDFESYAELCDVLPDENILTNIPNSDSAEITSYGVCPEGTTDLTDINNYSYLFVNASYSDNTGVAIICTLNAEMTLQEYCDDSLRYPQERTQRITVANTEAYYSYYFDEPYGKEKVRINEVAFSVDGDLYEIRSNTLSKENIIFFAEQLLTQ